MENASVARYVYKILKNIFQVTPNIKVRIQRRFRVKQIYILSINENTLDLLEKLNIIKDSKIILPEEYFLNEDNDIISYLKGLFLAVGSISNPKTSGYHFEYVVSAKKEAEYINKLLKHFCNRLCYNRRKRNTHSVASNYLQYIILNFIY